MKKSWISLLVLFLTSNALSQDFYKLDEGLITNIFTILDSRIIGHASQVSKAFNNIGKADSKSGKYLRKNSQFAIFTEQNGYTFLNEYLKGPRQAISSVDNLVFLLKEQPSDLIKLILHSIPHTHETIDSDLTPFHQEKIQIDNLISSLPTYKTSQQKLAGLFMELRTWHEVWGQVWDRVEEQVEAQVEEQVWDRVEEQVWDRVETLFKRHVRGQIKRQVRSQVERQVRARVEDQMYVDLWDFKFASTFEAGTFNRVLITAINYTFAVYQLGTLTMRDSEVFKNIHRNFSEFISQIMSEEQAKVILSNLNIPDAPEGNYLIDTQLKLIKRLLPNGE